MRSDSSVTLETDDQIRTGLWRYEADDTRPPYEAAWVMVGDELRLNSQDPAVLRALAAGLTKAADELEQATAERERGRS